MDVVDEFKNNRNSDDDTNDGNSDGSMSCEYHTSPSTSTSDSEGRQRSIVTKYYPSMFSNQHRRQCFSSAYQLQVQLNSLLNRNKASVGMYDEVVTLFNAYLTSPEFSRMTTLKSRNKFLLETEKAFSIESMKPIYGRVKLTDNSIATVPVFDATAMILSLLHDPTIMVPENLAAGYDIFTGAELDGYECNGRYGEVHTGDAWAKALKWHCGGNGEYMPIALILFGDKSHTDLHGLLSVEPVSFTLSLFNVSSRNLPQFWRLLGYIPNLSAGKGEANRMSAKDKIQNEHNCLSFVLKSLRDIDERGGIRTTVMGRDVHIKVWVHFIIGDTEGNNKWLGHYPGNNRGILRPYRDCQCSFDDLGKTNPKCIYTTLEEMTETQRLLRTNKDSGLEQYRVMSRYPIINALMQPGLALSDQVYGAYRMTPPELLHTSGAGLILYMFRVIADRLGAGLLRSELDSQHVRMMTSLRRQSERDFPRGATRNGIVDGTKCQASERRGNLFSLACITNTTDGLVLKEGLKMTAEQWKKLQWFLKQYLALEEWFHSANDKEEVRKSRRKIAKVLKIMQDLLPRGEGTNGYNIPKMHGMTKIQYFMELFGSAINFFGGPGESSHKEFVKAPGLKTQRRVSEFAVQTAKQYHHVMITRHANTCMSMRQINHHVDNREKRDQIIMEGKYTINTNTDWWEKNELSLCKELVEYYSQNSEEICRMNNSEKITGYTRARCIDEDGNQSIFYAHPCYRGSEWYDWAYVHFVENDEEVHYPSKILGFVQTSNGVEAFIQCASRPLNWSNLKQKMFVPFNLSDEPDSFVTVPLTSFVYTLCVIKDYGGGAKNYIVVLPRGGWGGYFGRDIV